GLLTDHRCHTFLHIGIEVHVLLLCLHQRLAVAGQPGLFKFLIYRNRLRRLVKPLEQIGGLHNKVQLRRPLDLTGAARIGPVDGDIQVDLIQNQIDGLGVKEIHSIVARRRQLNRLRERIVASQRDGIFPSVRRTTFLDLGNLNRPRSRVEHLTVDRYLPLFLLRGVLILFSGRRACHKFQQHRDRQHDSLKSYHTSVSFFVINSLASLGSALPLLRFITSPINILIIPFFPFLNSSTLRGNSFSTSSTMGKIWLWSRSCMRSSRSASAPAVWSGFFTNSTNKVCEAAVWLTRPSSTK